MSYLGNKPTHQRRLALHLSTKGLGDVTGDVGQNWIDSCIAAAPAQTAQIDAMVDDLNQNWHPTGWYSPADVRMLIGAIQDMTKGAWDAVEHAMSNTMETQMDNLRQAVDDLSAVGAQATNYLMAANQADATGANAVTAPAMRKWVIQTLDAASSAWQTAFIAECVAPDRLMLAGMVFIALATNVYSVAKRVYGIAAKAIKGAVDAAENLINWTVWLTKYGPPLAIGAGVLWLLMSSKPTKTT